MRSMTTLVAFLLLPSLVSAKASIAELCKGTLDADESKAKESALKLLDASPEIGKHVIAIRFAKDYREKSQACFSLAAMKDKATGAECVLVWRARTAPIVDGKAFNPESVGHALVAAAIISPSDKDVIEVVREFVNYKPEDMSPMAANLRNEGIGAYLRICRANKNARKDAINDLKNTLSHKTTRFRSILCLGACGEEARPLLRPLLLDSDAEIRRAAEMAIKTIDAEKN